MNAIHAMDRRQRPQTTSMPCSLRRVVVVASWFALFAAAAAGTCDATHIRRSRARPAVALTVTDALVNANREMEMDAEDYLERQHHSGHISLRRDIAVAKYEDGFVNGLHDNRITASVSKAWFDAASGNICCSWRDRRINRDVCHVSLAGVCRADFGCVRHSFARSFAP